MMTDVRKLRVMLSALGIIEHADAPPGSENRTGMDPVADVPALAKAKCLRLDEVLRAADRISLGQLEASLCEQRRSGCSFGDSLFDRGLLTRHERDVLLEVQRDRAGASSMAGRPLLGAILVATGKITAADLEDALRSQVATGRLLGEELIEGGHANKGLVEGGLLLQSRLGKLALVAAAMLVPLVAGVRLAEAGQSAALQVSASVVAKARLRNDHQAAQLAITAEDVARGYVDVAAASRFLVSTNSRVGYLLEFRAAGSIFESVQIEGFGNAIRLGADGGTIVQRGPRSPDSPHELSYRFMLRPDVQPGSYQWPLQLSVQAL